MAVVFSWDPRKAVGNRRKHRVTFEEALTCFSDPLARIFADEPHSEDEPREILIGYSSRPRLLVVSFTEQTSVVRLISARPATRKERRRHEEAAQR